MSNTKKIKALSLALHALHVGECTKTEAIRVVASLLVDLCQKIANEKTSEPGKALRSKHRPS